MSKVQKQIHETLILLRRLSRETISVRYSCQLKRGSMRARFEPVPDRSEERVSNAQMKIFDHLHVV